MENREEEDRYELKVVTGVEYNAFANTTFYELNNRVRLGICPGGHSDKDFLGSVVLCRYVILPNGEKYVLSGFAQIKAFSETGRPVDFGKKRFVLGPALGDKSGWRPPAPEEIIFDKTKGKGRPRKIG